MVLRVGLRDAQVDHLDLPPGAGQPLLQQGEEVVAVGHHAEDERVAEGEEPVGAGRLGERALAVVEAPGVQRPVVVRRVRSAAEARVGAALEDERGAQVVEEPQRQLAGHQADQENGEQLPGAPPAAPGAAGRVAHSSPRGWPGRNRSA